MSVLAQIGLVYLYLGSLITLLGLPMLVKKGRHEFGPGAAAGGIFLGVLSILAVLAIWASSSFASATVVAVILLALQVIYILRTLYTGGKGYVTYTQLSGALLFLATVAEVVLVSMLAFA